MADDGAATFRKPARSYERFMGRYSRALAPGFADFVGARAGLRALDVGCGPGALTAVLVDRLGVDQVVAVDPSESFVEACAAQHPGLAVSAGTAEATGQAAASFDLAAAQLVFHFVGDAAAAAAELRRVVRPGGTVAACVWAEDPGGMEMLDRFWEAAAIADPGHDAVVDLRFGRPGELAAVFGDAGLEHVVEDVLTVSSTYADVAELWDGFLQGIGPAGAYLTSRPAAVQAAIAEQLTTALGRPAGPFTLTAVARAVRATVPGRGRRGRRCVDLLGPEAPERQARLASRVTEADLDPELRLPLAAMPTVPFDVDDLAERRAATLAMFAHLPSPASAVRSTDHVVDADRGVVVRIHRHPDGGAETLPCLFTIHGGGYVTGSRVMDDPMHHALCGPLGVVGASVEYRLAPECPYPGPLEDCYDALAWVVDHADEVGVDPARLGIYGASAGGGLAAALALLVRDRDEFDLRFQVLMCPMLDDRQLTPSSRLDGLPIWNREANEFGWRAYLGARYGADDLAPYAAPARARDLAGLPPAYVAVGGVDGFRDENIDYAMRLNQAGVPCELHVYPGGPHGYQMFLDSAVAVRSGRDLRDWLGRQLAQ